MSVLGNNLKTRRLELDMTQEEVAATINKTPMTYSRYETGTLKPDIETLILLSKTLKTSIDALTGGDIIAMMKAGWCMGYKAGDEAGEKILRKRASRKKKVVPFGDKFRPPK